VEPLRSFYWWRLFKICVALYGSGHMRSLKHLASRPHDGSKEQNKLIKGLNRRQRSSITVATD